MTAVDGREEEAPLRPFLFAPGRLLMFGYTNWRGQRGDRHIQVDSLWWGSTRWHPEPQWLLRGYDIEHRAMRDFALKDMVPAV